MTTGLPVDWIPYHRPGDREVVGWIAVDGDDVTAFDRLGRELWRGEDYLQAEEALDAHGIGWLAQVWGLTLPDGTVRRVRVVEVTADRVRVKDDDFGDVRATLTLHDLPFPAPPELGELADPHTIDGLGGGVKT